MAATTTNVRRDIVVIGASAGGVEALPRLLRILPSNLPASVFVCQHQAAGRDPQLANILQRATQLSVTWAEQGERIEPSHVYVAPPDVHLTLADDHIRLTRGPRENYARPSIDRMFRSAAATHASRTIAVILTGMMEDGVAGALAVQQAGGRVIVQDPQDAAFPELPRRALATLIPDATLRLERIAVALAEMVQESAPGATTPEAVTQEAALDRRDFVSPGQMDQLGDRSEVNCPECGGSLWAFGSPRAKHWRCYLGHVVAARQLLESCDENVEASLWNAVRALHERASTLEALARDAREINTDRLALEYDQRAKETRQQADLARQFMLDLLKRLPRSA